MPTELDIVLRDTFAEFSGRIFNGGWRGREREAINVFVLGHLVRRVHSEGVLRDLTQVGIEVTVPSLKTINPKGRVTKDLVLWPAAGMTLWDNEWREANIPSAVLEWKVFRSLHRRPDLSATDIEWCRKWTKAYPSAIGYAVALDLDDRTFRIRVARVEVGLVDRTWLEIKKPG
jgi:hypothetical protein